MNAQILEGDHFSATPWQVLPALPDTRGVLEATELLVLPSVRPEPFGMVILEALASGCKVLATRGGGPDDLAPMFGPAMTLMSPELESVAHALKRWVKDDARGQTRAEFNSVQATIRDQFAPRAGAERWGVVLERFERTSRDGA
jgi:glycosyltransferase involved in cell wall biosynthesis